MLIEMLSVFVIVCELVGEMWKWGISTDPNGWLLGYCFQLGKKSK